MMERIEYRTVDKSAWGRGPWDDEPDKVQWQDEETGLPCLIVRNRWGALCGYVGLPDTHPWHGKEYSDCVDSSRCDGDDWHYECTPSGMVDVHGGLTFSGACANMSPERFKEFQGRAVEQEAAAVKHPFGDSARWLKDWTPYLNSHEQWRDRMESVTICHKPGPGEPDHVWWMGFDCGHCCDACPSTEPPGYGDETYRDIEYVTDQVRSLAKQCLARAA